MGRETGLPCQVVALFFGVHLEGFPQLRRFCWCWVLKDSMLLCVASLEFEWFPCLGGLVCLQRVATHGVGGDRLLFATHFGASIRSHLDVGISYHGVGQAQ
jgi:hypothetical protein